MPTSQIAFEFDLPRISQFIDRSRSLKSRPGLSSVDQSSSFAYRRADHIALIKLGSLSTAVRKQPPNPVNKLRQANAFSLAFVNSFERVCEKANEPIALTSRIPINSG